MSITIVICTHNRSASLQRTLESLNAARRPDIPVALLVVANACSDDTVQRLQEQASAPSALPLRWVEEPTPGKSFALNHALQLLTDPVAVFVDDDQRVAADYLVSIAEGLAAYPNVGMLCGRLEPDWDGSEPAWVHDAGPYRIYPPPIACFDAGDVPRALDLSDILPPGGDIVIRRAVFDRVGSFATDLGPRGHDLLGGEDIDFLQRALAAGETLQYLPAMVQYHAVDRERLRTTYLVRKSYQRSRSATRIVPKPRPGIPRYMWRKAASYAFRTLFSWHWNRRRFYLMRLAAALGEIRGVTEAPLTQGSGN